MFTAAAAERIKAECLGKKKKSHSVSCTFSEPKTVSSHHIFLFGHYLLTSLLHISPKMAFMASDFPQREKHTANYFPVPYSIGRPVIAVTDLLFYFNLFKMDGEAEL